MKRTQRGLVALATLALVVATALPATARAVRSSGEQRVTTQAGQRGQRGQGGATGQRGQMSQQGRLTQQMTQQQRQLIRATGPQSQGVRACTGAATQIRTRARALAGAAAQGNGDPGRNRATAAQIGDQVQTMLRQHDRLMEGLSPQQQFWLEDQKRDLARQRDRIQERLRELSAAVQDARPDPKRISDRAGGLAAEMERWERQYRQMGADMGVDFDEEEKK